MHVSICVCVRMLFFMGVKISHKQTLCNGIQ